VDGFVSLGPSGCISIAQLDEALFALPALLDFSAAVYQGTPRRLEVTVYAPGAPRIATMARDALHALPVLCDASECGDAVIFVTHTDKPLPATGAKRKIEVHPAQ
jgi:hypothetical protein